MAAARSERNMELGDLLESWKEIAAYLGHSIRTCQLWERKMRLPVHRLKSGPKAHIFAYKGELDRWLKDSLRPPKRSVLRRLLGYLKPAPR